MRIKWLSLIRVIGLVFVLTYHFFITYFPGGFVGVDLFFTLSGYLTTALLIDEFGREKAINLPSFFRRRFYRILPPLVLMVVLVTPLALLIRNDFIANIGQQITAALGFVTNFFEVLAGGNYENQFSPHLFVHTWSLAIEVHFYLLWGLAIWGMTRMAKTIGQLRGLIFIASTSLFGLSFFAMAISSFFVSNLSTIYFATWTHIFPFFVGSILATMTGIQQVTPSFQRLLQQWDTRRCLLVFAGGFSLELLLLFFLPFNSQLTYLLGFLLSSLATSAMILAARVLHDKTPNTSEPPALLFISDISYGLYLFHWPLYIIFSQLFPNLLAVGLTLIFSLICATASFYLLEPYLAGRTGRLFRLDIDLAPYRKWLMGVGAVLFLITGGIALFAPKLGSFEQESMVSNLYQAQNQLATTRTAAENAQATSYDIQEGVTIFGDSVTVRASFAIQEKLPKAQIDGTVSRHLTEISNLIKLYKDNNSLKETVVVALGTNPSDNYQELLDTLVAEFPKGHRLILVTPYDGNDTTGQSIAYLTGQYERELAKTHDYITIADWYQTSLDNPHIWAGSDYVHFNLDTDGAMLFAQTIQNALEQSANDPIKQN